MSIRNKILQEILEATKLSGGGLLIPKSATIPFANVAAMDAWATSNLTDLVSDTTSVNVLNGSWYIWRGTTNPAAYDSSKWVNGDELIRGPIGLPGGSLNFNGQPTDSITTDGTILSTYNPATKNTALSSPTVLTPEVLSVGQYGNLFSANWANKSDGWYSVSGIGSQFAGTPYTLLISATYHAIVYLTNDSNFYTMTLTMLTDGAWSDQGRHSILAGTTKTAAESTGWKTNKFTSDPVTIDIDGNATESIVLGANLTKSYDSGTDTTTISASTGTDIDPADGFTLDKDKAIAVTKQNNTDFTVFELDNTDNLQIGAYAFDSVLRGSTGAYIDTGSGVAKIVTETDIDDKYDKSGGTIDGDMLVNPSDSGNYRAGIRVARNAAGFSMNMFGAEGAEGTNTNAWNIGSGSDFSFRITPETTNPVDGLKITKQDITFKGTSLVGGSGGGPVLVFNSLTELNAYPNPSDGEHAWVITTSQFQPETVALVISQIGGGSTINGSIARRNGDKLVLGGSGVVAKVDAGEDFTINTPAISVSGFSGTVYGGIEGLDQGLTIFGSFGEFSHVGIGADFETTTPVTAFTAAKSINGGFTDLDGGKTLFCAESLVYYVPSGSEFTAGTTSVNISGFNGTNIRGGGLGTDGTLYIGGGNGRVAFVPRGSQFSTDADVVIIAGFGSDTIRGFIEDDEGNKYLFGTNGKVCMEPQGVDFTATSTVFQVTGFFTNAIKSATRGNDGGLHFFGDGGRCCFIEKGTTLIATSTVIAITHMTASDIQSSMVDSLGGITITGQGGLISQIPSGSRTLYLYSTQWDLVSISQSGQTTLSSRQIETVGDKIDDFKTYTLPEIFAGDGIPSYTVNLTHAQFTIIDTGVPKSSGGLDLVFKLDESKGFLHIVQSGYSYEIIQGLQIGTEVTSVMYIYHCVGANHGIKIFNTSAAIDFTWKRSLISLFGGL